MFSPVGSGYTATLRRFFSSSALDLAGDFDIFVLGFLGAGAAGLFPLRFVDCACGGVVNDGMEGERPPGAEVDEDEAGNVVGGSEPPRFEECGCVDVCACGGSEDWRGAGAGIRV